MGQGYVISRYVIVECRAHFVLPQMVLVSVAFVYIVIESTLFPIHRWLLQAGLRVGKCNIEYDLMFWGVHSLQAPCCLDVITRPAVFVRVIPKPAAVLFSAPLA